MADGWAFKLLKVHKAPKAHLNPLRDVCVQYERVRKQNADRRAVGRMGWTNIRGDTKTPHPHFVGRGIKHSNKFVFELENLWSNDCNVSVCNVFAFI